MRFISRNVIEPETTGDGGKRLVDDAIREADVPTVFVQLGAMVGEHAKHELVMNIDTQRAE